MAQIFSLCDVALAGFIGLKGSLALATEVTEANSERMIFEAKGLDSMNCRFIGFR
ncbi:hypothetical protein [Vibrio splendidus]|uniref:hypothetical protein n=1 Tax=Vibrio splendidus TaxID=29497 RepID=UPI001FB1E375|nr:hypothetical protein [Vibrio splendidus]UOE86403.1 hypothetical protein LTQ54_22160 [Vibrio splendidus]UOE91289.1 hypothetical protein LTQ02_16585 [Vibrio splendidus]